MLSPAPLRILLYDNLLLKQKRVCIYENLIFKSVNSDNSDPPNISPNCFQIFLTTKEIKIFISKVKLQGANLQIFQRSYCSSDFCVCFAEIFVSKLLCFKAKVRGMAQAISNFNGYPKC